MTRLAVAVSLALGLSGAAQAQEGLSAGEQPSFKARIDVVTLFAIVRDRHGRAVSSLSARDFELVDAGVPRPIIDCRLEPDKELVVRARGGYLATLHREP